MFSTDIEQLSNAISGIYGSKFNGERYLERFYDRVIPLSKPSSFDYLNEWGVLMCPQSFYTIIHEIVNRNGFSMRTSAEYYESLKKTEVELEKGSYYEVVISFFLAGMVPVLQAIRIKSIESYHANTERAIPDPIFRYLDLSEEFSGLLDRTLEVINRKAGKEDISEEQRKGFITDICIATFAKEPLVLNDVGKRLGHPAYNLPRMAERVLR